MKKRKKVSFTAVKRVPKKVKVKFYTKEGRKVSFTAVKRVPKKVKVTFYAKVKKRKRK